MLQPALLPAAETALSSSPPPHPPSTLHRHFISLVGRACRLACPDCHSCTLAELPIGDRFRDLAATSYPLPLILCAQSALEPQVGLMGHLRGQASVPSTTGSTPTQPGKRGLELNQHYLEPTVTCGRLHRRLVTLARSRHRLADRRGDRQLATCAIGIGGAQEGVLEALAALRVLEADLGANRGTPLAQSALSMTQRTHVYIIRDDERIPLQQQLARGK